MWSRSGPPRERWAIDQETFDGLDFLTHDWFPGYAAFTSLVHQTALSLQSQDFDNFYPFIPLMRGCRLQCGFCYGNHQRYVYQRPPVHRGTAGFEAGPGAAGGEWIHLRELSSRDRLFPPSVRGAAAAAKVQPGDEPVLLFSCAFRPS